MSIEKSRAVITKFIDSKHSDVSNMADDVVFTIMATCQEHRGKDGVLQMLNYFYHIAFDADAEVKNLIFSDDRAVFEADFVGKHIGEFAGVAATNKQVRVPLCVIYDIENDLIKKGRIYFEMPVLFEQFKS